MAKREYITKRFHNKYDCENQREVDYLEVYANDMYHGHNSHKKRKNTLLKGLSITTRSLN